MKVTPPQVTTCCAHVWSRNREDPLKVNSASLLLITINMYTLSCGINLSNKAIYTLFFVHTFFTIILYFLRSRGHERHMAGIHQEETPTQKMLFFSSKLMTL